MADSTTPPALNTRSQVKECKICDFCQIKKKLTELNSMIMCPTKAVAKKLFDENVAESKKRKSTSQEVAQIMNEMKEEMGEKKTDIEQVDLNK